MSNKDRYYWIIHPIPFSSKKGIFRVRGRLDKSGDFILITAGDEPVLKGVRKSWRFYKTKLEAHFFF